MTGWNGWMASLTQWTWVWVNSRSWWWTGRPGMLQSLGSQRVKHDWVTELNWTETIVPIGNGWSETVFFSAYPGFQVTGYGSLLYFLIAALAWGISLWERLCGSRCLVSPTLGSIMPNLTAGYRCFFQLQQWFALAVVPGARHLSFALTVPPYRTTFLLCSFKCHPFIAQLSSTSFLEFKNI